MAIAELEAHSEAGQDAPTVLSQRLHPLALQAKTSAHSHQEIRVVRILLIVSCMAVLACGYQPANEVVQQSSPVQKSKQEAGAESEEITEVQPEPEGQETVKAEPEGLTRLFDFHFGLSVASLEERIFLSDVIVRATLVSAAKDLLTFTAVEYLKGSGPAQFTVSASTADRNTQWDGNEAILFLSSSGDSGSSGQSGTTTFEFADTTEFQYEADRYVATSYEGDLPDGYTIDSSNPVWTPSETRSGAGGTADTVTNYIEASKSTTGEALPTFTLDELRAKIAWVEGGERIEGYDQCIQEGLAFIRYYRDLEVYDGKPLELYEELLAGYSREAPGRALLRSPHASLDEVYDRVWLEGEDAALFSMQVEDKDGNPRTGYSVTVTAVRPLPRGTYRVLPVTQTPPFQACDFRTKVRGVIYKIIVMAPEGTVYESLFDPADLSPGVGFSSTAGPLMSPGLAVGGRATTITGLRWESASVILTLDPFVSLGSYALEFRFIELDASISLILEASSATEDSEASTLTWEVMDQPWEGGDHLMLRVWTPTGTTSPIQATDAEVLSVGVRHTCSLWPTGEVVCWGSDQYGQSSPPEGERFVAISAGNSHTCGLRADGVAVCWGEDRFGQSSPPEDERFVAVSAGSGHTCGRLKDGRAVCWGDDEYGQSSPPARERVVAIAAGQNHTCGLRSGGNAVCWGSDSYGESSPPGDERFVAVSSGSSHTCGLRIDGVVVCWGSDFNGESSPPEGERFVAIAAGQDHTCGLRAGGRSVCWGHSDYGQSSPPTDEKFVTVNAGRFHTCGLRADDSVVCWGGDGSGQSSPP